MYIISKHIYFNLKLNFQYPKCLILFTIITSKHKKTPFCMSPKPFCLVFLSALMFNWKPHFLGSTHANWSHISTMKHEWSHCRSVSFSYVTLMPLSRPHYKECLNKNIMWATFRLQRCCESHDSEWSSIISIFSQIILIPLKFPCSNLKWNLNCLPPSWQLILPSQCLKQEKTIDRITLC